MDKARARQEIELAFMAADNELNARDDALPPRTHNNPPPPSVFEEIDDLFQTAKDFADGEPIADEAMHDTISGLRDSIHEAGKRADAERVAEKKPLDEQIDAIQKRYNPYIQPKKGKVDLAKTALGELLAAWRAKVLREKQAEAARKAAEAEAARKAAEEAIRATSGNLEARVDAEELLAHAKDLERGAKRADKAATTGTGLRTVWVATMTDAEAALDWAYTRDPVAFKELVQGMADTAVRHGVRSVPGFKVEERKVV
jgi:hypothetical protein